MTEHYTVLCDQRDRNAWLKARMQGVGASEVAAILGRNPYCDAGTLLDEKLGIKPADDLSQNPRVYWGNQLERAILEGYAQIGHTIEAYAHLKERRAEMWGRLLQSTRCPQLLATPDAWQVNPSRQTEGVVQVKNCGYAKKAPPDYYVVQVQAELAVTGLEWGSLVMLVGGNDLRVYDIEGDETLIEEIFEMVERFWRQVERRRQGVAA